MEGAMARLITGCYAAIHAAREDARPPALFVKALYFPGRVASVLASRRRRQNPVDDYGDDYG